MGPIASKILAELRKKRNVIDLDAVRKVRAGVAELEALPQVDVSGFPPAHGFWFRAFADLSAFGSALLAGRHLRKLDERIGEAEERYMPGGPPMSPLTDSFFSCWTLCDATIGPKKESLAAICCDVARVVGAPPRLLTAWTALAESYAGVYRIRERGDYRATLEELVTGTVCEVELADDLPGDPGELWLTRLLPPPDRGQPWTSFTTPYMLESGAAWTGYLERVLAETPPERRAQHYRRHMKYGGSPHFWFEFIRDGYAGERGLAVVLAGVPDRAATLPHSMDRFTPPAGATPLERVRLRMQEQVWLAGLGPTAGAEFAAEREELGGFDPMPLASWHPFEQILLTAHAMYGTRDDAGRTALDIVAQDGDLPAAERAEVDALAAGWFSVFEVLRIKIDEGIEVRDALKRRRFWISEKAATRGLALGDVIAGWVMVFPDRYALEGGMARVPRVHAPRYVAACRQIMTTLRARVPGTWRARHERLPPLASALAARLFREPLPMTLVNHDGDEVLLCEAVYDVHDADAVRDALEAAPELEPTERGYVWSERDLVIADVSLAEATLRVGTDSRQRHDRLRAWVDAHLGDAVSHRGDSFSDPMSAAHRATEPAEPAEPEELPVEVQEAAAAVLQERLHAWLDTHIPALRGRTPRQAVRSAKGRDDVAAMLLEQERLLASNPVAGRLDFRALWAALGLVHPGPPR